RRRALSLVLATVVLLALGCWISAARLRDRLEGARLTLAHGRAALLAGDAATALRDFRSAGSTFKSAGHLVSGPAGSAVRALPVLGRSADAVGDLSAAGALLARSGERIASAVEALPGGVGALAPTGGRVPVDRLPPL